MNNLKWRLKDLFLLITVVAIGCAAYRGFWNPDQSWDSWDNFQACFAIYLGLLALSTLGAIRGRQGLKSFFAGYALLNWICLATVLRFGRMDSGNDAKEYIRMSALGATTGAICGIIAIWITPSSPSPKSGESTK
jgi:hypothetical protein